VWDLARLNMDRIQAIADRANTSGIADEIRWLEDPRAAMAEVLQRFFSRSRIAWWITLTFRNPDVHTLTAMGSLRCWLQRWAIAQRLNSGCQEARPPISRLVWCAETQSRGTAHIHALGDKAAEISGPHCARCWNAKGWNSTWSQWQILKESWYVHHGIARIYPYDESRGGGVAGYVAKYMYKSGGEHGLWQWKEDF